MENKRTKRNPSPPAPIPSKQVSESDAAALSDKTFHPTALVTGGLPGAIGGATMGMAGGPAGVVAGGILGGVLGQIAGDALAGSVDPAYVDSAWGAEYDEHPFGDGRTYEQVREPLQFGVRERIRLQASRDDFERLEPQIERSWNENPSSGGKAWAEVRDAVRAGFERPEGAPTSAPQR